MVYYTFLYHITILIHIIIYYTFRTQRLVGMWQQLHIGFHSRLGSGGTAVFPVKIILRKAARCVAKQLHLAASACSAPELPTHKLWFSGVKIVVLVGPQSW